METIKLNRTRSTELIIIIMITIFALVFLLMPAKAETGTITVIDSKDKQYQLLSNGGQAPIPGSNYTMFFFDTADYNTVSTINITYTTTLNSNFQSNVTHFSCVSPNVCSGTASYSVFLAKAQWNFATGAKITQSPLKLVYDYNIFVDFNGVIDNSNDVVSATSPVCLDTTANKCAANYEISNAFFKYGVTPGVSASNNYNITYPSAGSFQTFVDKSGQTIGTNATIHSQTNKSDSFFTETTFNTLNYTSLLTQEDGIYINLSLSTGVFNNVLINASGSTVVVPTPTPTPQQAGASGGAISWDKTSYNIGDVGTLTGNVTVSPPLFGDIRITVVNSTGQQAFFIWDSSGTFPQIETFLFSFPLADTYTANLISHSPFSGDTILSNATVQGVSPVSYIFAPVSVVTGSNISIKYKFNPAPTTGAIEDVQTDINGVGLPGIYFNTSLCGCDTNLHSLNYTINGVGKHILRLWDTGKIKVVASTIVDVTSTGATPPQNVTLNFLALDGTQYSVGDVINGQYQISTTNWSGFGYFQASLISSGGVGMGSVTLTSQTGTFQIPVTGGEFGVFQSGAAFVNITAGNNILSATNLMASAPVTILSTHGSYSVSATPVTICKSQTEAVKFTGAGGIGILQEIYMTPAGTTKINNYSFNQNGTRQFVYNDGTVINNGGIIYSVLDTNGNFQVNTIVKYVSVGCTAPGITPPPGATPPPTGTQQANNLVTLITSNIFWALLITVGLMITIAWKTKDGFPTGTIGVLVSGIFTFLGWLPAWIFFTMFVIGALFIAASIVEKQMRNVVQ